MSYIPQLMSGRSLLHDGVNEKQWVSRGAETYVTLFSDFIQDIGETPVLPFVFSEAGSTSATGDFIDATDGVFRLAHSTDNAAESVLLSLGGAHAIACKDSAGNSTEVVLEARVKITLSTDSTFDAASNYLVFAGLVTADTAVSTSATLVSGSDDHVGFQLGSDSGTLSIFCESDDGVTDNSLVDSGIDFVSGTYVTLKIDMTDLANVRFFIDGVDANNGSKFDMSQIAAADLLEPFILFSRTATGASSERAHTMDIDYVKCTWKRS